MDSIIHQEHKEALLAYFFLWQHGAQSSAELDKEVERFLARLNEVRPLPTALTRLFASHTVARCNAGH